MARRHPRDFGTVRKLPSGRWQAIYTGPDNRRRTLGTFDTKREADDTLARLKSQMLDGIWRAPERGQLEFGRFLDAWLASRTDLAPQTAALYDSLARNYLKAKHGNVALSTMPIRAITETLVREWYAAALTTAQRNTAAQNRCRQPSEPGRTAVARAYALLRTALNQAVRDGILHTNPCTLAKGSVVRREERSIATPDEVYRAAKAMPMRYQAAVTVAAYSALRAGELFAVARRHIDLRAGTVRVERSLIDISGQPMRFGPPKSAEGKRTVNLPPHVCDLLHEHLAKFVPKDPDALVFGTERGTPVRGSNRSQMWSRARQAINRPDLRWHDLRHTGAVWAASTGASVAQLKRRLGHATVTAAMTYQHHSDEGDRMIAQRLADLASGTVVPLTRRERQSRAG